MSLPETTDLNLKLSSDEVNPEIESVIQTDPLLKDGIIEPIVSNRPPSTPFENGKSSNSKDGNLGEFEIRTPTPISLQEQTQSPSQSLPSKGRKRKTGSEIAVASEPEKNPDWLPEGWRAVTRIRPNGRSAGTRDTYYYEPEKNRQFRSKREVLDFLESGTRGRPKRKLKDKEDIANATPLQSSDPINTNTIEPPEKVTWVLGNSDGKSWTPFIGEERVPEHIKREWAAAFESIPSRRSGLTTQR